MKQTKSKWNEERNEEQILIFKAPSFDGQTKGETNEAF